MVKFYSVALLGLAASSSVHAAPFVKRIAQTISASTTKWEQACLAAGGGSQCNPTSITAFSALLAGAGPCDQQDAADAMVDLGKQLNGQDVITLAQIFAQQPRNSPTSLSVPYCQKAPKNSELNGLFQCQFQGTNPTTFVGGIAVGGEGTIPFGQSSPISPPGSCPAHTQGPIPDGDQLVDLVQSPGTPSGGNNSGNNTPSPSTGNGNDGTNDESSDDTEDCDGGDADPAPEPPASTSAPENGGNGGSGGSNDFVLKNGQDAQAQNAQFATLTADSPCEAGQNACVEGGFAQCVNGKFAVTGCSGGLVCAALPLVNSPGTSIACTTEADALARIQRTGATGGITG